jgi:hypothetical protein
MVLYVTGEIGGTGRFPNDSTPDSGDALIAAFQ